MLTMISALLAVTMNFSPRMVHSAVGIDDFPDEYLEAVAKTGVGGGKLSALADAAIKVPEAETFKIQELHLPVYHALCAGLEESMF